MTAVPPLPSILTDYIRDRGIEEPAPLADLRRATEAMENASWASSAEQAALLAFLARLVGARNTLDIGTFTGYSALAVAYALPPDGEVHAFDTSPDLADFARRHWDAAGLGERIHLHVGPAADSLDALLAQDRAGTFDMAFIDADKPAYPGYFEQALRLVRPGGLIALDNMLWRGKVTDPETTDDKAVALRALTDRIHADSRVDACLVPIRDGLLLTRVR
ncbi:O-methyltransferase [Roseospira visakhapatnamensis]|uniref:Putative O-methyltransferase YrrM n=1 Tax=Roseospira visakhapatnamensis TaxID=390880 RepID=A0A7W6RDU3_9PROT|nr:class I SAM-dependent methyltransferase [Roseospira visakhapatnamensis]MBB4266710.1 putative O-methyltransferase YrrM [Roseospira visakhapatnamensis]